MSSPTKTRNVRAPAVTEPDQVRTVSPSLSILEELEVHNSLASIEARLDSMEIDVARYAGSRDDDMRRISGELAVMKARVEDALDAFAQTSDDLREMAKDFDKRLAERTGKGEVRNIRAELEAKIDGVTAGVGDVLEGLADQLGARIDTLSAQLTGIVTVMEAMVTLPDRIAALEASVARGGRRRRR
jgi:hypothetical protein